MPERSEENGQDWARFSGHSSIGTFSTWSTEYPMSLLKHKRAATVNVECIIAAKEARARRLPVQTESLQRVALCAQKFPSSSLSSTHLKKHAKYRASIAPSQPCGFAFASRCSIGNSIFAAACITELATLFNDFDVAGRARRDAVLWWSRWRASHGARRRQ